MAGADRALPRQRIAVTFLNSHEHVHMLPRLFPVIKALAKEFDIRARSLSDVATRREIRPVPCCFVAL